MAATLALGLCGGGPALDAQLNGLKSLWDLGERRFRLTALRLPTVAEAAARLRRDPAAAVVCGLPEAPPQLCADDLDPDCAPTAGDLNDSFDGLDAVIVVGPPETREELVRRALDAGRHVFSGAPLARTAAAARELVDLAAARGVRLAVDRVECYRELSRLTRWCLARGELGEPQFVFRQVNRTTAPPFETVWGLLGLLDEVVGPVAEVAATTPAAATAGCLAQVRFVSGAVGQVGALVDGVGRVPLTICGSAACLRSGRLIFGDGSEEPLAGRFRRLATPTERAAVLPVDGHCAHGLQLHDWLTAIEAGVTGAAAGRLCALAEALTTSTANGGRPVAVG